MEYYFAKLIGIRDYSIRLWLLKSKQGEGGAV